MSDWFLLASAIVQYQRKIKLLNYIKLKLYKKLTIPNPSRAPRLFTWNTYLWSKLDLH